MRLPIILCRLVNQNGKILNPYDPSAIRFRELTTPENRLRKFIRTSANAGQTVHLAAVSVKGYVAVSMDGRNLSGPIPFSIYQYVTLYAPEHTELKFTVNNFTCSASFLCAHCLSITVGIETLVRSQGEDIRTYNQNCGRTVDATTLLSRASIEYGTVYFGAKVDEFNALSDGIKRVYTDNDDIREYGGEGILSPREVSYYNLYVNGVLQPKANYILERGRLEFVTENLPAAGQSVLLRYVTFRCRCAVRVQDCQFFALSDGQKKIFTISDEMKEYGSHGIPGPCEVSYYNLFINGVLQPKSNYVVEEGLIMLQTNDVPQAGQTVILESVAIKDPAGQLYRVEQYQYDTLSDSQRIYCTDDELSYGNGILEPWQSSYQNLFINAVNQPSADYEVTNGKLILHTKDLPLEKAPVSMQSIRVMARGDCICMCSCGDCFR